MKNLFIVAAFGALLGLVGCNDKGTSGGPGADQAREKEKNSSLQQAQDKLRQPPETFSLSLPMFSTSLKQGEAKEVAIGINRGKNFDEDVALSFEDLPQGVTINPASAVIKHGDANVKVTVKASDDAALGDHVIKLKAKPTKGKEATSELKIKISKK